MKTVYLEVPPFENGACCGALRQHAIKAQEAPSEDPVMGCSIDAGWFLVGKISHL